MIDGEAVLSGVVADATTIGRRIASGLAARPWLIAVMAGLGLVLAAAVIWLGHSLPISRSLEPLPSPALILLDAQGKPYARRGGYKEAPVSIDALPPHVVQAFLAIEDRRFYRHWGVDLTGLGRAALANARAGHTVQGGSTITQQLAKTSFLTAERSLRRKGQEAMIALWLELRLSKDEILSRYLSSIYFGDGVYGLGAASRHYFGKPPERLTVGEAALLAGIVKAPVKLDPVDHPQAARARADLVLAAMVETGAITAQQAAAGHDARARNARADLSVGGYFADWLSPQLADAFDTARYGEVRVATTLDRRLQRRAEAAVARGLAAAGKRKVGQAALVAMRPDGRVVAMVGGRRYADSQFNRAAQARRQPGSAFKLFVYLAALRDGARPDMMVVGDPVTIGGWTPSNHEGGSGRDLTLREAFASSNNIVAARIFQTAGGPAVVQAARDLGVTAPLKADDATLALGTAETTLLELTAAYAGVASGRYPVVAKGRPGPAPTQQTLDPVQRAALLEMLGAAVEEGTGRAARTGQLTYGKTGTTQDYRDALFIGFTGDLVVGVWVGNDDQSPMRGVTGGGVPAQIWRDFVGGGLKVGLIARDRAPTPRFDPRTRDDEEAPGPRGASDIPGWLRRILGL
ncbi:penicillin-binding protein [Caulobacter sp. B11]|uniref:transglycosylase domain-containing protein n=1 Tax=Caulobacter sp. B11 TaxID=2048899 RepID=UPI000C12D775|nr:transglycosylase domain-containing protein [Caulobacter sp. B11]PHY13073.1 penicillin-binding protein [Caulobacter sp. B11]